MLFKKPIAVGTKELFPGRTKMPFSYIFDMSSHKTLVCVLHLAQTSTGDTSHLGDPVPGIFNAG